MHGDTPDPGVHLSRSAREDRWVHPLLDRLLDAADGRFPAVDGRVTYVPGLPGRTRAVVAFTGHAFVATDASPAALAELSALEPDGFGGSLAPGFLLALAAGGRIGVVDATMVGRGRGHGTLPRTDAYDGHHRVRLARLLRQDVRVHGDERGFVTLADGLAGRREMSVEVAPDGANRGSGRQLIAEALRLVEPGSRCSRRCRRATRGACVRSCPRASSPWAARSSSPRRPDRPFG